jgi:hypothetical protein
MNLKDNNKLNDIVQEHFDIIENATLSGADKEKEIIKAKNKEWIRLWELEREKKEVAKKAKKEKIKQKKEEAKHKRKVREIEKEAAKESKKKKVLSIKYKGLADELIDIVFYIKIFQDKNKKSPTINKISKHLNGFAYIKGHFVSRDFF